MLEHKDPAYYRGTRDDIVDLVDVKKSSRVLEIGCAAGLTGEKIKKKGAKLVVGVEMDPRACNEAKGRLDNVLLGDVEELDLPFEDGYFDCIIYADVLEHLVDPWGALKRHRRFLNDNGVAIISIPNVRHYRVIKKLLKGRWDYEQVGVLDSTHLRFFTLRNIKEMLDNAGYRIENTVFKISASKTKKLINRMAGGLLNEFLAEQFLIRCVKV